MAVDPKMYACWRASPLISPLIGERRIGYCASGRLTGNWPNGSRPPIALPGTSSDNLVSHWRRSQFGLAARV